MLRRVTGLFAALLCAVPPAAARAQDAPREEEARYAETAEELDQLLWERDRELLHKGAPLTVVGLEQAENALREGTPALAKTDGGVASVDVEELRRRKLAMYEQRASFHAALPAGRALDGAGAGRAAAPRRAAGGGQGAARSWSLGWLCGIVSVGLLIAATLRARRTAR